MWTVEDQYPAYVSTPEQRHRWDLCLSVATTMSEVNEPSGVADNQFVWFTARWLYHSDLPTEEPDELDG